MSSAVGAQQEAKFAIGNPAIVNRVVQPTADQVREARKKAGLTQSEAGELVSGATSKPYRTWQGYEVAEGEKGHRDIPLATWELFLLLTGQHASLVVTLR